jgi:hypothetical protein
MRLIAEATPMRAAMAETVLVDRERTTVNGLVLS